MFEVLSTSGDTHLGGDDFDKRIVDFLADDFKKNEGIDLRKDRQVSITVAAFGCFCIQVAVMSGLDAMCSQPRCLRPWL